MKSTALIAFAASALASVATAQMLSYGAPITGTVWTAGKTETVTWSNDCSTLPNTTFPITLNVQVNGLQVAVAGVGPIGELDCAAAGSTTVTVPATVPQGSLYSILVVNGGLQSYSALFTINSSVPGSATSAAATGSATAATSAATATVSGSASSAPTGSATVTNPSATSTVSGTPKPSPNAAGALKAGSTAALVVVAAAAGLML
ncbi:hypothetical protein BGX28_006449 [Mortierella sp. GBA30]|nr:hypothetical protein BGX28_006449 [Mortierella sp. GBA30]